MTRRLNGPGPDAQTVARDLFHDGVTAGVFPARLNVDSLIVSRSIDSMITGLGWVHGERCSMESAMNRALFLAFVSVLQGGGPFGTVIIQKDRWVSHGVNRVTATNDPTHHGEVAAIRRAMAHGHTQQLHGATLVTSTAPCPMCFGLAQSVGVARIAHCCTEHDAHAHGGFCDHLFWDEVAKKEQNQSPLVTQFSCNGNAIRPDAHGQALQPVLQAYCKQHGFEPKGLVFDAGIEPIALCLFDYAALRWAGVALPHHVGVQPINRHACESVTLGANARIGRRIFEFFSHYGVAYGQR